MHEIYEEVVEDKEVEYVKSSKCFSGFLTFVILSLELINLSHGGFKNAFENLFQADNGSKRKLNWPVIIVSLLKVGIILFGATAFTWTNHPDHLAIAGFLVIIALSATRVLNHLFIHEAVLVEETTERAAELVVETTERAAELVHQVTKKTKKMMSRLSEGDENQ